MYVYTTLLFLPDTVKDHKESFFFSEGVGILHISLTKEDFGAGSIC